MQNASMSRITLNNNVIAMDDVNMSAKHLSKSIDDQHYDSSARRLPPTSESSAFPCRQCSNANWCATFPFIFQTETRRKFDNCENISLYNLWCDLKRRLLNEGGGNNTSKLKQMENNDGLYGKGAYNDCNRKPHRLNDLNSEKSFPLKSDGLTSEASKYFPCYFEDMDDMLRVRDVHATGKPISPVTINFGFLYLTKTETSLVKSSDNMRNLQYLTKPETQQFPLKLPSDKGKCLYFPQTGGEYYDHGDCKNNRNFQHLKTINLADNLKSLRKLSKAPEYFPLTRFPLEDPQLSQYLTEFPSLHENQTIVGNFQDMPIKNFSEQKFKLTEIPKFPLNLKQPKTETNKFPLELTAEKDEFQRITSSKGNGNNIRQNIDKLVELLRNSSNKVHTVHTEFTLFPLEKQLTTRRRSTFPCPTDNLKQPEMLIYFKTLHPLDTANQEIPQFPLIIKRNTWKFPITKTEQYLHSNKILKTLQNKQYITSSQSSPWEKRMNTILNSFKYKLNFSKSIPCMTLKEFPLNKYFEKQNNTKFPLHPNEIIIEYSHRSQPEIKPFPLIPKIDTNKFPDINISMEDMLNLSVQEIRLRYQWQKISHSLQAAMNYSGITHYEKAITKFPLRERLVKKFYRKFPHETDIFVADHHAWATVKHSISINFEKNKAKIIENSLNANKHMNVNIVKTTAMPTNQPLSPPPMTQKNLLKQQKQRNDNEQHAFQVQFTARHVHVENPAEAMAAASTVTTSTSPQTTNYDDLTILPARNTKNMIMPITAPSSEVGQYSENFEYTQQDAIINIRDEQSPATVLFFANIRNSLLNHQSYKHDGDADDEEQTETEEYGRAALRASTPTMSTTTSVQNAERIRAAQRHQPQLLYDDHDLDDLCNPQVAQIVECSDVHDTSAITVVNVGEISGNSSSTGSFLAKNETSFTSTSAPPTSFVSTTTASPSPSPTQSLPPASSLAPVASYTSSSDHKCRTSLENCPYCGELLPKYSVLELCQFCGNACNRTKFDGSKTGVTPQNCQSVDSQIPPETEIQNENTFKSEIATVIVDPTDAGEYAEIDKNTNEILLDFAHIDEMKFEMRSAKGALPPSGGVGATSSTSAATRSVGKYNDSGTPTHTSYARSKPTATTTTTSARNTSDHPSSLSAGPTYRRLSNDSTGSATSISGRSTPTSRYANDSSRATMLRRLSSDSTGSTKSISGRSTPTSRYANDSSTNLINDISNRPSSSPRYSVNEPITSHAMSSSSISNRNSTPSLGSLRNSTSTSMLSVDLPRYTPSTADSTASAINRATSLDTTSLDTLPDRSRLRRQRRLRTQDSLEEEEDPVQRLNRLKARITASLSEVKSVLKQYSTDENDNQSSNTLAPPIASYSKNRAEENEEGPVNFRFVKKIRRRSFLTEDEEDGQKKGQDETDKCEKSAKEMQLPPESKEIPNEITDKSVVEMQGKRSETEQQENSLGKSENNGEVSPKMSTSETVPIIKIEEHAKIAKDLLIQENKIQSEPSGTEMNSVSPKLNSTGNEEIKDSAKPKDTNDKANALTDIKEENNKTSELKSNDNKIANDIKSSVNTASKIPQTLETKVDNQVKDKNDKPIKKVQNTKVKNYKTESKIPQRAGAKVAEKPESKINDNSTKSKKEEVKTLVNHKTEIDANGKGLSSKPADLEITANANKAEGQPKIVQNKDVSPKSPTIPESNQKNVAIDISVTQPEQNITKSENKEISPKTSTADIKIENSKKEVSATNVSPKPVTSGITVQEAEPKSKELSLQPTAPVIKPVDAEPQDDHLDIKEVSPNQAKEKAKDTTTHLIKTEGSAIKEPRSPTENKIVDQKNTATDTFSDTPLKLRKKVLTKTKEPSTRRASLAAVEGSKIEPAVKLATPATIHRRPSDSEAIVKKKLITTKTTTSGAIAEVTPKPKILKIKRPSVKIPQHDDSNSKTSANNDTRHLAATQSETIPTHTTTINSNTIKSDMQPSQIEATLSPPEANKSIQGDKNKDVTMPNDKMLTQMPPSNDTVGRKPDRILPTQLVINEEAKSPSSSLTRKTIETTRIGDTNDRATNNRTTTTNKFESSEFENAGAAMLANVKTPLVSLTTASEANGSKQTVVAPEDLHALLQQEAVIVKHSATKTLNELRVDESQQATKVIHNNQKRQNVEIVTNESATPLKLEVSIEKINEPLDSILQQQQVVQKTDVVIVKSNDVDANVKALATVSLKEPSISIDTAKATTVTKHAPVNNSSSSAEQSTSTVTKSQQQQDRTPTLTISDEATTKTNSSPQISISRQQATAQDTTPNTVATSLPLTTPPPSAASKELIAPEETTAKMPELQLAPAPVQTAEIPHEPGDQLKKKVVVKKIIRQTSIEKAKKAEGEKTNKVEPEQPTLTETNTTTATTPTAEQAQDKVDHEAEVPQNEDIASATEECSETTEISEESSSQSEAAVALPDKPKKVRTIKKKVIIKRQKRRLSISDSFFTNTPSNDEVLPAEVETLEKPISYVSDDDDNDKHDEVEEVVEEKKPLKSCINKKEYHIGDEVLYAERFKRTQIRWKRGRVKEQITSISYLIDIDGTDVSSHINYLKKYTGRKVNFGGKEYLEIDYEQLAEEEERAERVQRRSYSIWNMV